MVIFRGIVILACAIKAACAYSAEITYQQVGENWGAKNVVTISGVIEASDYLQFRAIHTALVAESGLPIYVSLNSNGGSYIGGLMLASELARTRIPSVVAAGNSCLSACALAFLGGTDRNSRPSREIEAGATVGFHSPFLLSDGEVFSRGYVQEAFRGAVESVAMLVERAEQLHLDAWNIVEILSHESINFYFLNTIESIRGFRVARTVERSNLEFLGFTRAMVINFCINRWAYSRGLNAAAVRQSAEDAMAEYSTFQSILGGVSETSFPILDQFEHGGGRIAEFYLPVAVNDSGRGYVWCGFSLSDPTWAGGVDGAMGNVHYFVASRPPRDPRGAGQIVEGVLREPLSFFNSSYSYNVLDSLHGATHIDDIEEELQRHYATEPILGYSDFSAVRE